MAIQHAGDEYVKFHKQRLQVEAEQVDKQDFDTLARQITEQDNKGKK